MQTEVRETSYRWLILLLYSISLGSNAMMWITASPITTVIAKTYGVADIWVEMCSLVYMIFYIPVVFPSNYILDKFGLRAGVIIGIGLTTLGAWVRIGAYFDFWFILAGSCLGAIGQPFLMNAPAKLAATWFRPEMRTMATTVGTMSNPLGVAIGFVLPAIIVTASKSKSQIVLLMFVEAIICSVVLVLAIIMFKNLPKYPPSLSASQSREEFMPALKAVFKNKSFLLLLLAYSMGQGALNALATLIDLISKPYGFSTFDNSVFGGLLIICGLIGAGIVGTIVTITHKYKLTCIIMCFGTVATFFGFIFTLEFESLIISSVTIGLVGLILTPILPISYEFGIELTYPVGEAMTGGILNSGGQIIGISEVGLAYLLVNQPVIICIICAAGIGIGGIALIFVKEELQRAGIDNSASANFISLKEAE